MSALFSLRGVRFGYRDRTVLGGVDLDIGEGAVTAVLGPNGSGKTTLLKILLGLMRPQAGMVRFRDRDITRLSRRELARHVAYLPQQHRPVFPYTVAEVAMLGHLPRRGLLGRLTAGDRDGALACLDSLGLGGLADRPYTEISGGERQLTLLARAMVQGADVYIMDEPESSLDFGNQHRLLARIASLAGQGRSFIFSTHMPDHALAVADQAVLLSEGEVLGAGAPGAVIRPEPLAAMYGLRVTLAEVGGGWRVVPPPLL